MVALGLPLQPVLLVPGATGLAPALMGLAVHS